MFFFQKKNLRELSETKFGSNDWYRQLNNECSITIAEVTLKDHGNWTCQATEDPYARTLNSHDSTTVHVCIQHCILNVLCVLIEH